MKFLRLPFGLILLAGKDRYGQRFVSLDEGYPHTFSDGEHSAVTFGSSLLSLTIGSWPCYHLSKNCVAVHRLWVEWR